MQDYTHKAGLHKIVNGVAIRTEMATKRAKNILYKQAGIPDILQDVSLVSLNKRSAWKRAPIAKSSFPSPRIWWIQADAMSDKNALFMGVFG